ncbi:MAG: MotA/TolQ/ExbB proton channel family protein [Alphaproteobacteria bacterium GM202ARS2]|nr:MotA/TolQ/ExbB proton channel family protein [Alphaproteobacteria bacterium GM202ARS2]
MATQQEHRLFLSWLLIAGLYFFGFFVLWENGWAGHIWAIDQSGLAFLIGLLFLATTVHCGWTSYRLSQQLDSANYLEHQLTDKTTLKTLLRDAHVHGALREYLQDVHKERALSPQQVMPSETLSATHIQPIESLAENGWFISDAMIKLGLLGTVIGFIIMLSSLTQVDTLTLDSVQSLLVTMGSGMATALYTTLTGLTGSLLIAVQYRPLEHGGQALIKTMNRLALIRHEVTSS